MARLVPQHLPASPPARTRPRALRRSLLALAVMATVGLPATAPAQADGQVPATPRFGPAIDPYSTYERENGCYAGVQAGTTAFVDNVLRPTYGGSAWSYLTARACGPRDSGHEEGRAIDWMVDARVPGQYASAKAFLDWLLATDEHGNKHAMARRLGITYILYNNQMWRSYRADDGWLPQRFEGADCRTLDPSYATKCHRDHVHISLSWAGALQQTSWWRGSGGSATPVRAVADCETPKELLEPARPTDEGMAYVALPRAARILDTSRGLGSPGTCRVGPAGRLDLQVTGRGGVPSTGVGAVALNISVRNPSKSTSVAAYPAGLRYPGTNTVSVRSGGARATSIVLPVGTNGRVSLLNAVGSLDATVDVLGYYPTQAAERAAVEAKAAGGVGSGAGGDNTPPSTSEELELGELEAGEAAVVPPAQPLTYHPTASAVRVQDTREDDPYDADSTRTVRVTGRAPSGLRVPTQAKAVVVNVTAHARDRSGALSVVPHGQKATSDQNGDSKAAADQTSGETTLFGAGESISNRIVVPLSEDGTIDVHTTARADVVLDVVGWFGAPELADGARYVPLFPARVLDTRAGLGIDKPLDTRSQTLQVAGQGGVPLTGARAVAMTLTGWQVSEKTSITTEQVIADVHVAKGETAANLSVPPLRDGKVRLDNAAGTAQVLGEVLGYYR